VDRAGSAFGKYTLTRLLGKGGMGEVYEAYDTAKGRTVALKILSDHLSTDATFRMRFQRESQAAAILQEPHVIPIHDWGEIDGQLYIDMRLVQGRTLSELLQEGPLEPARAVSIIGQVAAALDAAQAEGLIHRDVKPQNIIVTPADFAYLVDFGIAEVSGQTHLTTAGSQIGTFHYMAPERFRDEEATAAVDVYSLACVLYESLTGETPFTDGSVESLLAAQLYQPPPLPSRANPRVPVGLDEVITRGMAKQPDDRYATASTLAQAAQRALQPSRSTATGAPVTVAEPAGSSPSAATAPWVSVHGDSSEHGSAAPTAPWGGAPTTPAGDVSTEATTPAISAPDPGHRERKRMSPRTLVAAAAAVVVIAVVVVVLLVRHESGPTASRPPSSTGSASVEPTSAQVVAAPLPASAPAPTSGQPGPALPLLVTGPDHTLRHQVCDEGFALPTATGFGTHAGRGTPSTGCVLAKNVLTAYWARYGDASPLLRSVSARGAADCRKLTDVVCDGPDFVMQCQQNPGDNWITCTGALNGRVYLW
jgi:serine/threonine protein kinase